MQARSIMQIIFILIMALLQSCATSSEFSWKEEKATIEMSKQELEKIIDQGLLSWQNRNIKLSLNKALYNFELAFFADQDLPEKLSKIELATFLSRGYYQLGDYHEKEQSLKLQAYKIGGEWAQRGFALNKYFQTAILDRGHFSPGLKFLDKSYVGCLYWYLANIGKWALNSGVNTTIKYKTLFYDISMRIIELDEKYYHGGIYRIMGAYYAVLPSYAGGDLNKSWDYFQKSLSLGPEYLGTKILMAQAFAVYRNDAVLFQKIINEVIQTKLEKNLDIYPENILEKEKALILNTQMDTLFE